MDQYFEYGEQETAYLKGRDLVLGAAIDRIGPIRRAVIPDLFAALVNAISGQQISSKAHATIWARMNATLGAITPESVNGADVEVLQACGMSLRKAGCIKEAAAAALKRRLDLDALQTLSDEEVCAQLVTIRGVGLWTAEMLLTFSMQRPDVMSYDDLAIMRGLRMLYRHKKITPKLFAGYKKRYSPHATVASLYLWAIAGGALPDLADPAQSRRSRGRRDVIAQI
jgi:DNA-3-methyladenine glycosylase II